jgi:2'-5' RNA ligase
LNKLRTFLSLNFNNTLKEKVSIYQEEIKRILAGFDVKWENPDKFHMTLRFLGDVNEDNVNKLILDFELLHFDFDNILFFQDSIDFFPNKLKPNVIFFGLKEENNYSRILTAEIDKVILKYGITPDKKFVPHITLGRFRRENRKSAEDRVFPLPEKMEFDFDRFCFMKSIIDFRGSKHFTIKEFLFKK